MSNPLLALPPLDAIRGFVAVSQRMSITLAARDLCLTPSAVSRQIQALEEHFGTPLLIRKHRAIALTAAGEQLFGLSAPWLDELGVYTETVRTSRRPPPITLSASVGVASLWILPQLGVFQAANPMIDVRLATSNQMQDLRRDGVDLAIRYCPESQVPAGAVKLFDEYMAPVASPALAERAFGRPAGLFEEVLIELDDRARPWLCWSDWLNANGMPRQPKAYLRFNHYDQVIQAALDGYGVALGRIALIMPMLDDGRLVAKFPLRACGAYAYWLVNAAGPMRSEVRQLHDWIVEAAKWSTQRLDGQFLKTA
jgi:LysR family glycine cleavage system transcriptional activator